MIHVVYIQYHITDSMHGISQRLLFTAAIKTTNKQHESWLSYKDGKYRAKYVHVGEGVPRFRPHRLKLHWLIHQQTGKTRWDWRSLTSTTMLSFKNGTESVYIYFFWLMLMYAGLKVEDDSVRINTTLGWGNLKVDNGSVGTHTGSTPH